MPAEQRLVWNYAKTNKNAIIFGLQDVDWHRLFANKTVNQQVNLLDDIIQFFKNFVPDKFTTCDDKDSPWVNKIMKNKIKCNAP